MGLAGVRTAVSAFPSQNAAPLKLQFGGSACMLAVMVMPQALPAQALPQAPQFFGSLLRLASQPLAASPSQSLNGGLQIAITHLPFMQLPLPLAKLQGLPQ